MAFFAGSVGNIYRQFSAGDGQRRSLFSAFLALSLTPALCATLLKPVEAGHHHAKRGFFGWFNRGFTRTAHGYEGCVGAHAASAPAAMLVVYAADRRRWWSWLFAAPADLVPAQRRPGLHLVNVQLPPGATQDRTLEVMQQVEGFMLKQPEVQSMVGVLGFSFSGQGQNAALAFVHAEGLGRAQGRRAVRRRRWPGAPSAR